MSLHCLELCDFREDPFTLVPKHAASIWVERNAIVVPDKSKNLREFLMKICTSPIFGVGSGVTEFTSIVGDLGSGKSHTMIHVCSRIKEMYPNAVVVYLPTLQVSTKVMFCDIFFEIMRNIGIKELERISEKTNAILDSKVQAKLKTMPKKKLLELQERCSQQGKSVHDLIASEIFEEIYADKYEDISRAYNLIAAISNFKDNMNEVFDWFVGKKKLDFSWKGTEIRMEKITSDYEAEKTLGNLINALLALRDEKDVPTVSAFILMIDQFDRLARFSPVQWGSITDSFAELLREVPEGFCLITGFMGEASDLEAIAGKPLADVLTSPPIWLEAFSDDEAADFLRKLLEAYRKEKSKKPKAFPFRNDSITEIVNRTPNKIPRKLIENARKVFYYACSEGILDKRQITAADVEAVL